ncbi:type II secretion system F family protein [Candidatus Micrarchaeota archaeon]|nr:type II secretion system F family protein [Candidatus Micrarchaeota archaeon]
MKPKPQPATPHPFVTVPMREPQPQKPQLPYKGFFLMLTSRFPDLKNKLVQAGMHEQPVEYVAAACSVAALLSILLLAITYWIFLSLSISSLWLLPLIPVYLVLMFFYAMAFPTVKMRQRAQLIDQELVFAGRHMQISIKAGVPLFNALLGISRDYGEVSVEFNKIVEKVTLGVSINVALSEAAAQNPSQYFRRLVLQLSSSITSGSDLEKGLQAVLDQISREQAIALKSYGQKLNPLVMFFMIFGVIMPSLGVAFAIILLSFIGGGQVSITPPMLAAVLALLAIVQFLFLGAVESSRPRFDIL